MTGVHLVIQGDEVATPDLKAFAALSGGRSIERVTGRAFRIAHADPSARAAVAAHCESAALDWGFVEDGRRLADFGLLALDMDSTLFTMECIDEIADFAGRKSEVAAVTAAAMRGEIDWPQSLRSRVAALGHLVTEVGEQARQPESRNGAIQPAATPVADDAAQGLAEQIGRHQIGLTGANVDGHDSPPARVDVEKGGIAPADSLAGSALDNEAALEEVADEQADAAAADAHRAGEVGSGNGLVGANQIQHDLAVDLARGALSGDLEADGIDLSH